MMVTADSLSISVVRMDWGYYLLTRSEGVFLRWLLVDRNLAYGNFPLDFL